MAEYVKLKDTILEGVFGWCESAEEGGTVMEWISVKGRLPE